MWMVDNIPHYWGSVLTASDGIGRGYTEASDQYCSSNVVVVGSPLLSTLTPEWSNIYNLFFGYNKET